jgi:hypothetical protein
MKHELWSQHGSTPPVSEVIETVDLHCQYCGRTTRYVTPPELVSHEKEVKHYRKMAEHFARKYETVEKALHLLLTKP